MQRSGGVTWRLGRGGGGPDVGPAPVRRVLVLRDLLVGLQLLLLVLLRQLELVLDQPLGGRVVLRVALARRLLRAVGLHLALLLLLRHLELAADQVLRLLLPLLAPGVHLLCGPGERGWVGGRGQWGGKQHQLPATCQSRVKAVRV